MFECAKTAASSTLCPAMTGSAPSATKTSKWSVQSDRPRDGISWPWGVGAICRVWRYGNNVSCRGRHHAGSGAGEYRTVYLVTKYGPAIAIEWSAININTRTNVFLRIFHLRFMYEDMRYGGMHKVIYYQLCALCIVWPVRCPGHVEWHLGRVVRSWKILQLPRSGEVRVTGVRDVDMMWHVWVQSLLKCPNIETSSDYPPSRCIQLKWAKKTVRSHQRVLLDFV